MLRFTGTSQRHPRVIVASLFGGDLPSAFEIAFVHEDVDERLSGTRNDMRAPAFVTQAFLGHPDPERLETAFRPRSGGIGVAFLEEPPVARQGRRRLKSLPVELDGLGIVPL